MRKTLALLAALACSAALPAAAQQKPDVTGGTAVASEPGKAAMVRTIKVTAQVVQIDKGPHHHAERAPTAEVVAARK
jgi:hypothetical protein